MLGHGRAEKPVTVLFGWVDATHLWLRVRVVRVVGSCIGIAAWTHCPVGVLNTQPSPLPRADITHPL